MKKPKLPKTMWCGSINSMSTLQKVRVLRRLVLGLMRREQMEVQDLAIFHAPSECYQDVEKGQALHRTEQVIGWMYALRIGSDDALSILELFAEREISSVDDVFSGSESAVALDFLVHRVNLKRRSRMTQTELNDVERFVREQEQALELATRRKFRAFTKEFERVVNENVLMASLDMMHPVAKA